MRASAAAKVLLPIVRDSFARLADGLERVIERDGAVGVALEAAASGQGVAMGRATLVEDDLEAGRLARPFELGVPVSYGCYVACPEATARRPRIEAFRAWLLEEARRPGRG